MTRQHYLIVGGGIAGISIATALHAQGHAIHLIDNNQNRSSIVAAGMINPIVFRRMTKSWRVDEFMPKARQFYAMLEQECNATFFHDITIRRLFSSAQEREFWLDKQVHPAFTDYLSIVQNADDTYPHAMHAFGSGKVKQSAYVDANLFLTKTKHWLAQVAQVSNEQVDYSRLEPAEARYKDVVYTGIVFCEGADVCHNPWFGHIPVQPTKGEVLTIKSAYLPEDESLNRKCFVLPIGDNTFRVGSTYTWNTYNDTITEAGKNEISQHLSVITKTPFSILEHRAGIRPTTLDRRPIMGNHPQYSKLYIYNGLGAKGYLLAPLLGEELANYMLHGTPLDKECVYSRLQK